MPSISYAPAGATTCATPINALKEVVALKDELIANRRWFHAHPELSFKEVITAAKVADLLRSYGISEVHEKVGRTGVIGLIRGGLPGPCIALRADMDGLPIVETADIPYKSTNEGVMHACGHDGHMAGLLAAAKVLHEQRASLAGVVKLVFQPAEEGYGGAKEMIADGCLVDGPLGPAVDQIYGLHIWSHNAVGVVACSHGPVMAASDKWEIDVKGSGGHGAAPHKTVDAIVEAAHLVTTLQTVVSRSLDPLESSVLTVGTVHGGHGYNIIADKVRLTGTCRSFDPATQDTMERRMHEVRMTIDKWHFYLFMLSSCMCIAVARLHYYERHVLWH